MSQLSLTFIPAPVVSLSFEESPAIELTILKGGGSSYPVFEGPYVVIPKTEDQVLATNKHVMTDDVTVKEIPYAEVSNVYGTTVTIAS